MTDFARSPLIHWNGPFRLPVFEAVADEDYAPAFRWAIAAHKAEVEAIAADTSPASIESVLKPLELAGEPLSHVSALFWLRAGAHTNDTIKALEREISPELSRHYTALAQNPALFARIDALWERRGEFDLDVETFRVLERHWKGFVRSGAKLPPQEQQRLSAINERLSLLGAQFGQNVLADEAEWSLWLDSEDDPAGLPDFLRDAMAQAARDDGGKAQWRLTLSRSLIEPFLTFSERRDLRETAFKAWIARGEGAQDAARDNRPLVAELLALRHEKARLLGYENYAAYKLEDTMAKTPAAVEGLLLPVWEKALERAGREAQALADLAGSEGHNHAIEPWDWRHFAEKRRQAEFDLSEAEIKPYLQLENIIDAAFDVAGRLFGLSFVSRPDIAGWHGDVRIFEVRNADGSLQGMFFGDYFARSSKRSGAWMSSLQSQHKLDGPAGPGGEIPFIYNVMNFAKAAPGEPSLLSMDDARTLFHEFGHALHGLLSNVTWPAVSGTGVSRDFVELPSQLYEHWLDTPQVLEKHARHYRTGEPMPASLRERMKAARNFNSGFQTVEFTASALVDMAYHTAGEITDPEAFEAEKLQSLSMPKQIVMRHRSPHFGHVFSGDGYSAGYYSYMWSEVLDADAFAAFEETGDPFNAEVATKLRQHVYAAGGSQEAEATYTAFRGRMPSPDAMMRKRGLA